MKLPFKGKIKSYLHCTKCDRKGIVKVTSFCSLTLNLSMNRQMDTLSSLIQEYLKPEILTEVNCGFCSWKYFLNKIKKSISQLKISNSEKKIQILENLSDEISKLSSIEIDDIEKQGNNLFCVKIRIGNCKNNY